MANMWEIAYPWLSLKNLVFLAGALHLCCLPGTGAGVKLLGFKEDLAKLNPLNRKIVLVMGGGIMLAMVGLGFMVMASAGDIAAGTQSGMAIALFVGIFWLYRFSVQVFIYPKLWPQGVMLNLSFYGLAALLGFLTAVYFFVFFYNLFLR